MRPYVEKCQKLPPGIPNLVYPQSKAGVAILNEMVSIAGSKPVKSLMGFFGSDKKNPSKRLSFPTTIISQPGKVAGNPARPSPIAEDNLVTCEN
jgi:hypothetical protein